MPCAADPQPKSPLEPVHTTHYSVVDPDGDAVSVTTTLNESFGSHVTAEGLGFLLAWNDPEETAGYKTEFDAGFI